jgi:hypothetical protein
MDKEKLTQDIYDKAVELSKSVWIQPYYPALDGIRDALLDYYIKGILNAAEMLPPSGDRGAIESEADRLAK